MNPALDPTPIDSTSRYAHLTAYERVRWALEDVRAIVEAHDALDLAHTTAVQDIVNQGLCTGRRSGCFCDWCESYDGEPRADADEAVPAAG